MAFFEKKQTKCSKIIFITFTYLQQTDDNNMKNICQLATYVAYYMYVCK